MPIEGNLDLLEYTHAVLSLSSNGQKALEKLIEISDGPVIQVPIEFAAALKSLLAVEHKMIVGLMEQNQQIVDRVDDVVRRLEEE